MAPAQQGEARLILGAGAAIAVGLALYALGRHKRRTPYSAEDWSAAVQPEGQLPDFEAIALTASHQGIDPSIRAEVWPFLLDVFSPQSTHLQRQQQHAVMVHKYQQLLLQCQALEAAMLEHVNARATCQSPAMYTATTTNSSSGSAPAASHHRPASPYQLPDQVVQFSEAHKIIVIDAVRTDFRKNTLHGLGGISGSTNQSGTYNNSSSSNGPSLDQALNAATQHLQGIPWWQSWLGGGYGGNQHQLWVSEAAQQVLDASTHLSDESKRQAVRMIAILSAYAVHDQTTGYCQGMSDLLLPFLVLLEDDALAFWCFTALMQTLGLRRNFAVDESGINAHLSSLARVVGASDNTLTHRLRTIGAAEYYFVYRMIVVLMRRDMPLHQVMTLWDMLFADEWCQRHLHKACSSSSNSLNGSDSNHAAATTSSSSNSSSRQQDRAAASSNNNSSSRLQVLDRTSYHGSAAQLVPGMAPSLFICFVASVIISQKRRILDECWHADDVLRLFHSLRHIDLWECSQRAHQLRSNIGKKII